MVWFLPPAGNKDTNDAPQQVNAPIDKILAHAPKKPDPSNKIGDQTTKGNEKVPTNPPQDPPIQVPTKDGSQSTKEDLKEPVPDKKPKKPADEDPPPPKTQADPPSKKDPPPEPSDGLMEAMQEINFQVPFRSIGKFARIRQIQAVGLDAEVLFVKTKQVNKARYYWEGTDRYKYEEWFKTADNKLVTRVLLVGDSAWYTGRTNETKALIDDNLAFYQNFNYPMIVSSLIPFAKEVFDIKKEDKNVVVRDDPCFVLKVGQKDRKELRMFFSDKEGLLRKVEFRGRFLTPELEFAPFETDVELYFTDYKDFNGIRHWSKMEQWRDGEEFTELIIKQAEFFTETNQDQFVVTPIEAEVKNVLDEINRAQTALENVEKAFLEGKPAKAESVLCDFAKESPTESKRIIKLFSQFMSEPRLKANALGKTGKHGDAKRVLMEIDKAHESIGKVLANLKWDKSHKEVMSNRQLVKKDLEKQDAFLSLVQARMLLERAKRFSKSTEDGEKLKSAIGLFKQSDDLYQKANRVPGVVPKAELDQATADIKKGVRLLTPISLVAAEAETLEDWTVTGGAVERVTRQQKTYIRMKGDGGTIRSRSKAFPKTFEYTMILALQTEQGALKSKSWKDLPDILVITFEPENKSDAPLTIRVGRKDAGFGPVSEITVNKKSSSAFLLETATDWTTLSLVGKAGEHEVRINDKLVASVPATTYKQVNIRLANVKDAQGSPRIFPSITSVTLTALE
jgi:hypothetical protein